MKRKPALAVIFAGLGLGMVGMVNWAQAVGLGFAAIVGMDAGLWLFDQKGLLLLSGLIILVGIFFFITASDRNSN